MGDLFFLLLFFEGVGGWGGGVSEHSGLRCDWLTTLEHPKAKGLVRTYLDLRLTSYDADFEHVSFRASWGWARVLDVAETYSS